MGTQARSKYDQDIITEIDALIDEATNLTNHLEKRDEAFEVRQILSLAQTELHARFIRK